MEKVYEELDEAKSENAKLKIECRNKTEILNNLKKLQTEQLVEIQDARSVIEKQGFEIEEKTREISELQRTNEDLQRCLREKDLILKRMNEANEKLKANGEDKCKEFQKLMLVLDEASEKNIDMEQRINVYRAEIEGLKGVLAIAEKKTKEVEKTAKSLRDSRGRDDVMVKMEEAKSKVEEKLKWKKEQFKHLEEAYKKLQNQFEESEKERDEERRLLYNEINSLQTKLDSMTRILEDTKKKLEMCNSVLSSEETRRKRLEIEVSEFKSKYEDAFAECQDAKTKLEDLASQRDEYVAELRQVLCIKETDFKEMKYENRKLEEENRELLDSLKELQEATIQGSGNSALTKMKNKFRNLENVYKNCLANLRSKEAEWSSQVKKMEEEIHNYKSQLLQSKETVSEAQSQLEGKEKNVEIEEEGERVLCLLKRIEILEVFEEENLEMKKEIEKCKETVEELTKFQIQMKEKSKEAEKDYEEKLLQVCDALDNTNSELVTEREKVMALRRQIESYKELLEESEKRCVLIESESKENVRELCSKLDIAYVKLAEEVKKTKSIDQSEENTRKKLSEVSETLEKANSELFDKTSEVYQLEFQLWIWKSIAKRLKAEFEENRNLRKRVEASLVEQVGVGEAMRQEIEFLEEESLRREVEVAVFTHITTERKLQGKEEDQTFGLREKLQRSEESVTCLETKLRDSEAERENLLCFIGELENRMSKLCEEEDVKVTSEVETETETKKMKIIELENEISSLRSEEAERKNLLCFMDELMNGMSKLCDEDMKMMRRLERTTQHCDDGFGKENKIDDSSSRLVMKNEGVVEEERLPFREIN